MGFIIAILIALVSTSSSKSGGFDGNGGFTSDQTTQSASKSGGFDGNGG